jgi:hypothetical protein
MSLTEGKQRVFFGTKERVIGVNAHHSTIEACIGCGTRVQEVRPRIASFWPAMDWRKSSTERTMPIPERNSPPASGNGKGKR